MPGNSRAVECIRYIRRQQDVRPPQRRIATTLRHCGPLVNGAGDGCLHNTREKERFLVHFVPTPDIPLSEDDLPGGTREAPNELDHSDCGRRRGTHDELTQEDEFMRSTHSSSGPRGALAALIVAIASVGILGFAPPDASASPTPSTGLLPSPSYADAVASGDWLPTPGGLTFKSCVHEVPDDAVVSIADRTVVSDGVTTKIPACPYSAVVPYPVTATSGAVSDAPSTSALATSPVPLPSGWWLSSWWSTTSQITSLSADWTVPANPTSNGGTIFLFPSVESTGGTWIVQPVLQWGSSAAGGGNSWNLASWYVGQGTSLHTALLSTSAGHVLHGNMSRSGGSSSSWTIKATDTTTGYYRTLGASTSATSWPLAQGGVLEVYNVSYCSQLPNTTAVHFTNVNVATTPSASPSFTGVVGSSSCSGSVHVSSTYTYLWWTP